MQCGHNIKMNEMVSRLAAVERGCTAYVHGGCRLRGLMVTARVLRERGQKDSHLTFGLRNRSANGRDVCTMQDIWDRMHSLFPSPLF